MHKKRARIFLRNLPKCFVKVFYFIESGIFLWLILNIVFNNVFIDPNSYGGDFVITSYYNPFIVIGISLLTFFFILKIRKLKFFDDKIVTFFIFFFIVTLQIFCAWSLVYDISDTSQFADLGTIIESAKTILRGDVLTQDTYYGIYYKNTPYQIGILSEIVVWNKFLNIFGLYSFNINCVILNILSIDFAILGGFITCKLIFKKINIANTFLLLCLLFSPFYTYVPYYYTDSLSIPFAIWGICLYCYINILGDKVGTKKKILLYLAMILIFVFGMFIKVSVVIAFIAVIIHMLFSRQSIVKIGCVIISIWICFLGVNALVKAGMDHRNWFSYEISSEKGYPKSFWILMGSNEKRLGAYPPEDVNAIVGLPTREEQSKTSIDLFKTRMKEYGIAGYIKFLTKKNNWIWGDGRYYATQQLVFFPHIRNSKVLNFFTQNQIGNPGFCYWSQCIHILILCCMLGTFITGIKNGKTDFIFVINVTIFGVFLFFCIWEGRPRYLFNFTPLFIISAVSGLGDVGEDLKKLFNVLFLTEVQDSEF